MNKRKILKYAKAKNYLVLNNIRSFNNEEINFNNKKEVLAIYNKINNIIRSNKSKKTKKCLQKINTLISRGINEINGFKLEEEKCTYEMICISYNKLNINGKQKKENKNKRINYKKYIQSNQWKKKRNEHFKFNGKKCLICGTNKDIHVHHSTYENLNKPNEIFDLVSLCSFHHDELHKTHDKSKDLKLHTFEYIERVRSTISIG